MNSRCVIAAGMLFSISVANADEAPEDVQALALIKRAVDYYQVQGDAALPAFSRQGEFIDADRFIFVVDAHGTLLASGGPSAVLIGRQVSKVLAPELEKAFNLALASKTPAAIQSQNALVCMASSSTSSTPPILPLVMISAGGSLL